MFDETSQLRGEAPAARRTASRVAQKPPVRRSAPGAPAGVRTHRGLRPGTTKAVAVPGKLRLGWRDEDLPIAPPPSARKLLISAAVVIVLWGDSVLVGSLLAPPQPVRVGMLALHLASMILGLGAVLVLDHTGLQYVFGRKTFQDVMKMTEETHLPIWLGFGGLLLSGAFLAPTLNKPIVLLKMVLVLGCGLGGVNAMRLSGKARQWRPASPKERPPIGLLVQVLGAGGVSQLCWWGAFAVGMLAPYVD